MKYMWEKLKLTDREMLEHFMFETDLTESDINVVVGGAEYKKDFEAITYSDGSAEIRNKKTKKVVWRS